jgi:hypothetical protein
MTSAEDRSGELVDPVVGGLQDVGVAGEHPLRVSPDTLESDHERCTQQHPTGADACGDRVEERLVLVAIEERPVSDHVEALIEPSANQLTEDHLGLTKPRTRQADERADRLDELIVNGQFVLPVGGYRGFPARGRENSPRVAVGVPRVGG